YSMNRNRDKEIWDSGVMAMENIYEVLQDPMSTKFLTYEDIQKGRAVRIHITYILGLTYEVDQDNKKALEYFKMCKNCGESGFTVARKLVTEAQLKIKKFERIEVTPSVPEMQIYLLLEMF
ncbi:3281_t:CDS:2, partial [Racocetra persica]